MRGRLPWWKESVMPRARKYPVELLERATRLVFESGRPIAHVPADLGLPSETLRKYVRQVEANEGLQSSIRTVRSERVHRSAPRAFRGRADLSDLGRVGVRVLRTRERATLRSPT